MTAIATVLDIAPAYGWQGGPEFNTRIVTLKNGHERRNANWAQVRHRFTLPFQNIKNPDYLTRLKSVFLAVRGQTHSFLAKDWSDYQATGESLGVAPAGSAAVQLQKIATFGAATYTRTITKPKAGTVTVYQTGVAKAGTFDTATGLFTPTTAWTEGEPLTADFEFYVPVRFASDMLPMSIDNRSGRGYVMNGSTEVIEVFGE
jgi:uncharacterized protein (TIGR02217 family)